MSITQLLKTLTRHRNYVTELHHLQVRSLTSCLHLQGTSFYLLTLTNFTYQKIKMIGLSLYTSRQ